VAINWFAEYWYWFYLWRKANLILDFGARKNSLRTIDLYNMDSILKYPKKQSTMHM
jgi:hypothetical protein